MGTLMICVWLLHYLNSRFFSLSFNSLHILSDPLFPPRGMDRGNAVDELKLSSQQVEGECNSKTPPEDEVGVERNGLRSGEEKVPPHLVETQMHEGFDSLTAVSRPASFLSSSVRCCVTASTPLSTRGKTAP